MAGKSNIEWTGHSWNPLAGCSVLTPGCKRCYAMKLAKRLGAMGNPLYKGLTKDSNGGAVWTGEMRKAPRHTLLEPLRRKKPTTWFVNSMSDLFHENVPDEWINEIFAVMALCPQHTFQVLTKRAERMRDFMTPLHRAITKYQAELCGEKLDGPDIVDAFPHVATSLAHPINNGRLEPLSNIWLGVSTERQQEADERIPLLLQTPAAIRFISAEPLLGPIELWNTDEGVLRGCAVIREGHITASTPDNPPEGVNASYPGLDWVIVGGESGTGHRDMDPAWAKSLIDQCVAAGVSVFMKQMAGKKPIPDHLMVRQFPRVAASEVATTVGWMGDIGGNPFGPFDR